MKDRLTRLSTKVLQVLSVVRDTVHDVVYLDGSPSLSAEEWDNVDQENSGRTIIIGIAAVVLGTLICSHTGK